LVLLKYNFLLGKNRMVKVLLLAAMLILAGCVTAPQIPMPAQEPSAIYLKHIHPQVILVLGSGGARGFSHVGVLKVLQENHIPIDMIVGTSAGAIVGALYADQPSAARVRNILLTAKRDKVIDFSIWNIASGPIGGAGIQQLLKDNMQAQTFEQLRIPFVAVASNLDTGQLHVFGSGPIPPAVNASAAAPPFFRPVKMYGALYADGGLIDPTSVDVAKTFHPKIIIAVRLDTGLSKEMPTHSWGYFLRGFDLMLINLTRYSAQGADVIIAPDMGDINMFEDSQRPVLMHEGEVAAKRAIPAIKKLLAENNIPLRK
jgi:NTE family protein